MLNLESEVKQQMEDAIWAARSLFERGRTAGSSANISFRCGERIYISSSGSCFARLTPEDFSVIELKDGQEKVLTRQKPSKELPLHRILYRSDGAVRAVIHTHSCYSVLWSCLKHDREEDVVPPYTPYLKMKVGTVGRVPYAPPGSEELFALFAERAGQNGAYLLGNHGPVAGGTSVMDAFYKIEEMEESMKVAWHLREVPEDLVHMIR